MANLRLKKLILEVVDNQLRENNPPVTKESYDKLIDAGYSAREAKEKIGAIVIEEIYDVMSVRACLKNHSCNLHAPLCGIFYLHSVDVARYAALIQEKSPTNCDAHLAESLFQTRSSEPEACLHGFGERRMAIMNEVHDIMKENQPYDEKRYTQALRNMVQQCIDYEDTHEILTEWAEWGFSSRL